MRYSPTNLRTFTHAQAAERRRRRLPGSSGRRRWRSHRAAETPRPLTYRAVEGGCRSRFDLATDTLAAVAVPTCTEYDVANVTHDVSGHLEGISCLHTLRVAMAQRPARTNMASSPCPAPYFARVARCTNRVLAPCSTHEEAGALHEKHSPDVCGSAAPCIECVEPWSGLCSSAPVSDGRHE